MNKLYTCDCGKTFITPQSYNGHKSHCIIHMKEASKLDKYKRDQQKRVDTLKRTCATKSAKTRQAKYLSEKDNLEKWIQEKHLCEKCGKIMTEKYGSGRFCSRSCANSRTMTQKTKDRIKKKKKNIDHKQYYRDKYSIKPKVCEVCGKILPYEMRKRKTCSEQCLKILQHNNTMNKIKICGGNINKKGVRGTAKHGLYKNIFCDSSYELAVVIYCLDHNIPIQRCPYNFSYIYNNKEHLYYPDFLISNTIVEIKNYSTELVQIKAQSVPKTYNYLLLYKKDIYKCIDYCINVYGKDYVKLYD